MRVLVTYGSKHGGTAEIARTLGGALEGHGFAVVVAPAGQVTRIESYQAVIIGGALYANRWHPHARRFVRRHLEALRRVPVWLFSSGPLDDSADRAEVPATRQVAVLAERLGARGHVTFGGRLARDARGFPASLMARTLSGDWRSGDRIRAWAAELAAELPTATPGPAHEPAARALPRLFAYAALGWTICAATMLALLQLAGTTPALVLHAVAAPSVFAVLAWRYFRVPGAREPLPTAAAWTLSVAALDLVVVAGLQGSLDMFRSFAGTWLPFALIFGATWLTGTLLTTLPWPQDAERARRAGASPRAAT